MQKKIKELNIEDHKPTKETLNALLNIMDTMMSAMQQTAEEIDKYTPPTGEELETSNLIKTESKLMKTSIKSLRKELDEL